MSDTYGDLRRRDTLAERSASSAAAWQRRQDFARWSMILPTTETERDRP